MAKGIKKRKRTSSKDNVLPQELEDVLGQMARENLGRSLSEMLQEDSPLKTLIGRFVEISLEEEMAAHLGYAPYERQQDENGEPVAGRRANTRNGHSSKTLKTSLGAMPIKTPRDRAGTFEPHIVPRRGPVTEELEGKVISMYAKGMSTRDISDDIAELYGMEVSDMFVSRLVERLDPMLSTWRNRPLEAVYPVMFVDCIHQKVRHSHGVVATALYQVCAYNETGQLEVLGIWAAPEGQSPHESASFWHQVFVELEKRGVKDILILCADGLAGLEEAARAVFDKTLFLTCVVHLVRNSLKRVEWKQRQEVAEGLKAIYTAPSYEAAEYALLAFEETWGRRYPSIVKQWTQHLPRLSPLWSFSQVLRKLVYTTNAIENLNRQVRKVTKTRGVFPNVDSALRLMTLFHVKREEKLARQTRTRSDWRRIVTELRLHFGDRLPEGWGMRYLNP